MNLVTVYCICFNEEVILPFFIKHYRKCFPNCKIVVYDNESTDNSVKIALEADCEVISYNTNNQLSDNKYLEIKNNCWKNVNTPWVLVCDCDEWLCINENQLKSEQEKGATLISSEGYNMCNKENLTDLQEIKYGIRSTQYDKILCFNRKQISQINYSPGGHSVNPVGKIVYSENKYIMKHIKFFDEDYMVIRYKLFAERMSEANIKNGWGFQYTSSEEIIRKDYKNHLAASIEI